MHIGIAGPIFIPSINLKYEGDRSNWPVGMGGVPVNHLINALLELGYHISVYSSSPEIEVGESFEWHEENISIYLGPFRKRARNTCSDFFAIERNYIKNAIIITKPDFVHAHWQYEWAWGALDSGLPTLVTCHDSPWHVFKAQTDMYRFLRMIIAIIVLNKARNLTAVSECCANGLKLFTSKNIEIIPNFEPDKVFSYYKIRKIKCDGLKIVMINNGFTSLKNVGIGIEAFVKFRAQEPNSELHLFGTSFGEHEKAYKWCNERFELDNIYFHGAIPFDDLMLELSSMDIFLHTSIEESFGMVIVEAMAMGIPVIAGRNSGGPEWILNEGGGVLVDVKNVHEVIKALNNYLDPAFYVSTSIKAREVANNRFSKNKVITQYLEAYEKLLNQK